LSFGFCCNRRFGWFHNVFLLLRTSSLFRRIRWSLYYSCH
jgi:hypothetical protein